MERDLHNTRPQLWKLEVMLRKEDLNCLIALMMQILVQMKLGKLH